MRSLDPSVLAIDGDSKQTVKMAAKGTQEVRFDACARCRAGGARIQMSREAAERDRRVRGRRSPSRVVVSPEMVAAYGEAPTARRRRRSSCRRASSRLRRPAPRAVLDGARRPRRGRAVPRRLSLRLRGAARVAALALMLAADLGEAFRLPGIEPAKLKEVDGGDAQGAARPSSATTAGSRSGRARARRTSPYLTSYVLHVLGRGTEARLRRRRRRCWTRGYDYLEKALASRPAARTRAGGPRTRPGRRSPSRCWPRAAATPTATSRALYGYRERMPVFGARVPARRA